MRARQLLNARLKSGIDIVLDESGFDELAKSADVIVTGEGRFDSQSIRGKVMSGVCKEPRNQAPPYMPSAGALQAMPTPPSSE